MAGTPITRSVHLPPMRFKTHFTATLTNNVLNSASAMYRLGLTDPNNASSTLADASTRLAAMKPLFRYFRIHQLKVTFIPQLGDASSGTVGVCVDADPMYGGLTTVTDATTKEFGLITNVRKSATLVWKPHGPREKMEKFCEGAVNSGTYTIVRDYESLLYGSVAIRSSNGEASGVTVGYVMFEVDISFEEAK